MCDVRFTICDLRFAIYDLRDGDANSPSVAEGVPEGRGSNIDVRFTIYDLRDWRRKTIISNIWPEGRPLGLPG